MKILNNMKEFDLSKILICDEVYIKDLNIKINFFQNFTEITDLKNAEMKGKEVQIYGINHEQYVLKGVIKAAIVKNCDELIGLLEKMEGIRIDVSNKKGIEAFTPFKDFTDQANINKITDKNKINKNDMIKLLRSKNAKVKCVEQLTDDYRYDNANNFFKDVTIPIYTILKSVIENNHFTFFKKNTKEYTLFSNFESYKLLLA
jgi:hypothetical protein